MKTFREYIIERLVDPQELANRAARRYGKKSSYGKWEKTEKGKHIPLSTFNSKKSDAAGYADYKLQKKLGFYSPNADERNSAGNKYEAMHVKKNMKISDLTASQPFVRTGDQDILKSKIENPSDHIRVITHKGVNYIADGHHAVMAAKLRGEKEVPVSHINLDEVK
jgi:hypothetical protein